jgi:hypothetical protein
MLDRILRATGLLRSTATAETDPRPPALPPRMIVGGKNAAELCMLPVDAEIVPRESGDAVYRRDKRIVQLKADGIRALYIEGRIVTREGTALECALHCQPGLRRLEDSYGHEMMFDGEYVADGGFNATIGEMQRREGKGTFWAFDALPLGAWIVGGTEEPIEDRLTILRRRIVEEDASASPFAGFMDWWMLDGEETYAKARELWAAGYEGVVVKQPGSPYRRERAADWQRIKQVFTHDLIVQDIMMKGGVLQKIVVFAGRDIGNITISTGWDVRQAREIQSAFKMGYAIVAEVAYQLTTGEKRSVRGARFIRLRGDKALPSPAEIRNKITKGGHTK